VTHALAARRRVARHYARAARRYSARRDRGPAGWVRRREQAAVFDVLSAGAGEWVLDVGCGDGAVAGGLVRRGVHTVSVDLALPMAILARRRGAHAVVADMAAPPVRRVFDWVACVGALEFAPRPDLVLGELARCLRPGGRLVLLFPRRNWLGWALRVYHAGRGLRIRLWSRRQLERWLAAAGFAPATGWRRCAAAWVCRTELAALTEVSESMCAPRSPCSLASATSAELPSQPRH
jgi:SAM-dependent methyltransferase